MYHKNNIFQFKLSLAAFFLLFIQVFAIASITEKSAPSLNKQKELYKKYFMPKQQNNKSTISPEEPWEHFLSQPSGVSNIKTSKNFSLISHPNCIETVWLSIESLMRQEIKANRIILNLHESEFPNKIIPWTLEQQMNRGLEINWIPFDKKAEGPFTRSDILHPSPSIPYFSTHSLNELVILHYNAHLPISKSLLNLNNADLLEFKNPFEQFQLLGGELKYLATEGLPSEFVNNASLIKFKDKMYMTLRVQGHVWRRAPYDSDTFFSELDDNYTLTNSYRLVEDTKRTHEDARLIARSGSLYAWYVTDLTLETPNQKQYSHCMEIAQFEPGKQIKKAIRPAIGNNTSNIATQKNWLFFEKNDQFLVINNINPMEVWNCTQSLEKPIQLCKKTTVMNDWIYGEIRASTTPVYLKEYNLWLVIFHSYLKTYQDNVRRYFLGALVFDNDFNIKGYTNKPFLASTPHTEASSLKSSALLPYGCIRDNNDIILSFGINTHKVALGRLPINRIMELLKYI